jgi:hypothetical protein
MDKNWARPSFSGNALGDYVIPNLTFPHLDQVLKEARAGEFQTCNFGEKRDRLSAALLKLIQTSHHSHFLLPAVIDAIDKINALEPSQNYTFSHFELWLNQFSGLSKEDNAKVRGKITGKWIPRDVYQIFFPISMGKTYPGSHFVTAHSSPDLDTTVASFWGWVEAFAARVSDNLHIWNVPGGAPAAHVEISLLFNQIFGEGIFDYLAKTRTALSLSSLDFLKQKGVIKKSTSASALTIDHERDQHAVILIDDNGYYLGDWRYFDVEGVRQVIMLLSQYLRWFENDFYVRLITLFSKPKVTVQDLKALVRISFEFKISDCEPVKGYTQKQRKHLQDFLTHVLHVKEGMDTTFDRFASALKTLSLPEFEQFISQVEKLETSGLFDKNGMLIENRPLIFQHLDTIIQALNQAIQSVRTYMEHLHIALGIKTAVFNNQPHVLSDHSDLDEMRAKMGNYPYLTVTHGDEHNRQIPLGVVYASDLHKTILGTVSVRDFCNREETKIPSYLEVISVIDHHKTSLSTSTAPTAIISDAQSSNALVAMLSFQINDGFSTNGMTPAEIEKQLQEVARDLSSMPAKRIMQRLLKRQITAERAKLGFFIDPLREFVEYLHYLYAILDDTDLLTKVTSRDVEIVASLLNRLKSLMMGKEVEIIELDDLVNDPQFAKKGAERILQNPEMYSLYRKIYLSKEEAVDANFALCVKKQPSTVFADTKEQNGCCRVGQTKIFARNLPSFQKSADAIRSIWLEESKAVHKEKPEVDLYMHMISTVVGAEDVFSGSGAEYAHKDELWIWIPETEPGAEHLRSFLNAFRLNPTLVHQGMEVEFLGQNGKSFEEIFSDSFFPIPRRMASKPSLPIAILRFKAGTINSRKAMISPYLPKLAT